MDKLKELLQLPEVKTWLAVLVAVLAIFGVTITVNTGDNGTPPPPSATKVVIKVDGKDKDKKRDDRVVVKRSAIALAARSPELRDKKDETPAGAPRKLLKNAQNQVKALAKKKPLIPGGASATQRGCQTHFVRNQSSRVTAPTTITWHYTVSPNLPGDQDLDGLDARANNPATQVSWAFSIDRDGNCHYNVPWERKAWHVAAGNSLSVGIEVVNTGTEGSYMGLAGYRKLALVTRDIGRQAHIPMRRAIIRNCRVERSGISQHLDWGICGGGHHDIAPYSFTAVFATVFANQLASSPTAKLSKPEKKIVSRRCFHFKKRFQAKKGSAEERKQFGYSRLWKGKAGYQKSRLDQAHVKGQPWKTDSIGTRRKVLSQTERFHKADRRAVCA